MFWYFFLARLKVHQQQVQLAEMCKDVYSLLKCCQINHSSANVWITRSSPAPFPYQTTQKFQFLFRRRLADIIETKIVHVAIDSDE